MTTIVGNNEKMINGVMKNSIALIKKETFRRLGVVSVIVFLALGMSPAVLAGGSMPFPGSGGGSSAPAPGSGGMYSPAGIGWNPGPPPSSFGGPWGPSWSGRPVIVVNTPLSSPDWQNRGHCNVIACGYDARGVWRTLPLRVAYDFNGISYNVSVLNAWNPWTGVWNIGVDVPAYNTSYFLRGQTFDYYTVLPTGTFYFNL